VYGSYPVGNDSYTVGNDSYPVGNDSYAVGSGSYPVGNDSYAVGNGSYGTPTHKINLATSRKPSAEIIHPSFTPFTIGKFKID
jgi:hypothetical protein